MGRTSYMPHKEAEQVAWAATLVGVVGEDREAYGVPTAMFAAFQTANTALQAAWVAVQNPSTRTKVDLQRKDDCLREMKRQAGNLVSIIQGTPGVSDPMKLAAGLTVRKTTPTKRHAPAIAPYLVLTSSERIVSVELKQSKAKRGKLTNATVATIFTATGAKPQTPDDWTFATNTSLPSVQLPFGPSETGTTVWVCAFWSNAKGESGPASAAASIGLPAGTVMPKAAEKPAMKIRAAA